uniref:Metalloendopeptidase n=1 Tax=Strongyloides papillosus TaxID=174720 RepID=A0A0N5B7A5_STREA
MFDSKIIIADQIESTDIIENRRQRDIFNYGKFAWSFPIKYYIEKPVLSNNVYKAIQHIQNNTCVTFHRQGSFFNNTPGLIFKKASFCSSYVGLMFLEKSQEIYLSKGCYENVALILHEIGHALGLVHEHSRNDRDKYIKINKNAIQPDAYVNFEILSSLEYVNYSTTYDAASLMHYKIFDYAINKSVPTISSKVHKAYEKMMGQRMKMTFNDYKQINLKYCNKCNWVDNNGKRNRINYTSPRCINGGYPHYNDCHNKCICPTGYTGSNCEFIESSNKNCGKTSFKATKLQKKLFFNKKMTCYIHIKAKKQMKIKIRILKTKSPYRKICTEDISIQIKHFVDKGNTGLLLCGQHKKTIDIISSSNSVLIIYRGRFINNYLSLSFKEVN